MRMEKNLCCASVCSAATPAIQTIAGSEETHLFRNIRSGNISRIMEQIAFELSVTVSFRNEPTI